MQTLLYINLFDKCVARVDYINLYNNQESPWVVCDLIPCKITYILIIYAYHFIPIYQHNMFIQCSNLIFFILLFYMYHTANMSYCYLFLLYISIILIYSSISSISSRNCLHFSLKISMLCFKSTKGSI